MESESQTRKRRIDTSLETAGWTIVPFRDDLNIGDLQLHAVEEYPTDNGPADYALFAGGQLPGVVEAKIVGDLREIVALIEQEEGVEV